MLFVREGDNWKHMNTKIDFTDEAVPQRWRRINPRSMTTPGSRIINRDSFENFAHGDQLPPGEYKLAIIVTLEGVNDKEHGFTVEQRFIIE